MDRVTKLRGQAGGSKDTTLDDSSSSLPNDSFTTANESSKYFSLTEDDSSFDISPIKDVSLASAAADPEKAVSENELISNLSPTPNKIEILNYKIDKQIEDANILSGGVEIFDDNNSYDGNELVIDDNVDIEDKSNIEMKLDDNEELRFQKADDVSEATLVDNDAVASKDTEIVLQIDGKNVNAIDIGNGLYLYRKEGQEELAAVQIIDDDQNQPNFKFLKVRENAEGNLEVYEEIEVPKEVPPNEGKLTKKTSHFSVKDDKVISDQASNKMIEDKSYTNESETSKRTTLTNEKRKDTNKDESKIEFLNGEPLKLNEKRKSPVIRSTPNKEGIPLTKTMVDLHLHPNRQLDNVKTIEVHTDIKHKQAESPAKNKDAAEDKVSAINKSDVSAKSLHIIEDKTGEFKEPEKNPKQSISSECQTVEKSEKIIHVSKKEEPKQTLNIKEKVISEEKVEKQDDQPKKESNFNDCKAANDDNIYKSSKENRKIVDEKGIKVDEKLEEKEEIKYVELNTKENNFALKDSNTIENKVECEIRDSSATLKQLKTEEKSTEFFEKVNEQKKAENVKDEKKAMLPELQKQTRIEERLPAEKPQNLSDSTEKETSNTEKLENNQNKNTNELRQNSKKNLLDNKLTDSKNLIEDLKTNVCEAETCTELIESSKSDTSSKRSNAAALPLPQLLSLPSEPKVCTEKIPVIITATDKEQSISPNNRSVDKILKTSFEVTSSEKQIPKLNQTLVQNQNPESSSVKPVTYKVEPQAKNYTDSEINKQNLMVAKHSTLPAQVQHIAESKIDTKKDFPINSSKTDQKSLNNNHAAVPFGKWTEAHSKEFLNKIKESKIPTNISNTKQIRQPNDLNRRDVLQKIDSQRQNNNAIALAKIQESKNIQMNVKVEAKTFASKPVSLNHESQFTGKTGQGRIKSISVATNKEINKQEVTPNYAMLKDMPNTVFSTSAATKKEPASRKEINNQDLIDKTIEGIINKAILGKPEDKKQDVTKSLSKTQQETVTYSVLHQSKDSKPSTLDAIEMKMNELHGIPFVERPPHELPHRFKNDINLRTYGPQESSKVIVNKASNIPVLQIKNKEKTADDIILDLDSEEEVIEFVPVTGDITVNKANVEGKTPTEPSMKDTIITENEFDKFARRNSITYENCLTVSFDSNQPRNVVQSVVEKEIPVKKYSRNELLLAEAKVKSTNKQQLRQSQLSSKIQITSRLMPVNDETLNKNYHSKLQMAYQSALTAKRQKESPITIIEDKPVKVVFMDSNHEFIPKSLNVQGNQLSPIKKNLPELDVDSLDSDILDITDDTKIQDELKCKTKHQRKQVLTPVETPELELIEPKDLTVNDEGSPKKKKKIEDSKSEKSSKHLLPKKTYLLNRNAVSEENIQPNASESSPKQNVNTSKNHSDAASAIDNLVKAAELLENQSESLDVSMPSTSSATPQVTPVKRGRGRPRKYPLPDEIADKGKTPNSQKKPRLNNKKRTPSKSDSDSEDDDSEEGIARENWTMGKINENIVCPICNKLFRSENVVFKHVKHCSGPSPNRQSSGKRGRRKSKRSGGTRKSRGSKSDETNDTEKKPINGETPKKSKSNDSPTTPSASTQNNKDEIIIIEDSPASEKPPQQAPRRPGRPRIYPINAIFECEFCGKQFRQMSYLVNHKLQHKKSEGKNESSKTTEKNSVFSCEVCKKEFRKLHHLVQHRLIHNSNDGPSKPTRKSSLEEISIDKVKNEQNAASLTKQDDQNAAFRCEPCDKSFRKLHHLVEHRETHDGINKQKVPATSTSDDKPTNSDPPQCHVCNKTFRKLHHLVEHKEQHNDTNSDRSDDKSVKSSLSTKDIIHECSLCYMVFPNEHSLNKHTIMCQKKKKQAAEKQTKAIEELVNDINKEEQTNHIPENKVDRTITIEEEVPKMEIEIQNKPSDTPAPESKIKISDILQRRLLTPICEPKPVERKKSLEFVVEPKAVPAKRDNVSADISEPQIQAKLPKLEEKTKDKIPTDEPETKGLTKEKSETKRRKLSNSLVPVVEETSPAIESSDDDEVRYMLNPDYKAEQELEKIFLKVRANKRNSLQVERPSSKDLVKRRISLQHTPKIPRLKPKPIEVKIPSNSPKLKLESVSSMDSDDSEIKYSFPENVNENNRSEAKEVKPLQTSKSQKDKKKSLIDKQKVLTGMAKRKFFGKAATQKKNKPSPNTQVKRRNAEVEHRCDCGELFSSAALLMRHTSLAHTPPRIRRNRSLPPQLKPKPRKSTPKTADSRKSSSNDKPNAAADSRKSSTNDKLKVTDSRKSNTNEKIKQPHTRKSSVNDKPKLETSKSSVNEKSTKKVDTRKSVPSVATDLRKSNLTYKPKPTAGLRKTIVNSNVKEADKPEDNSEYKTPKRKSIRVENSTTRKRTITKARRETAHRGVPVPEKLKKLMEKQVNVDEETSK